MAHSPTPWKCELYGLRTFKRARLIFVDPHDGEEITFLEELTPDDAAFIVKACNNYERLREVLEDSNCLLKSLTDTEQNEGGMVDQQIAENKKTLEETNNG